MTVEEYIHAFIEKNKDIAYQSFTAKLIPNIDPATIIGVRIPLLRKFANELFRRDDIEDFLTNLPHKTHDENILHSILISKSKNFDEAISMLNLFLPHVTNWAVCDTISPKIFDRNITKLKPNADRWINSNDTYAVRYGIDIYMSYRLDDNFCEDDLDVITNIVSDEYYINMMRAWYFATALAFQYDSAVKIIESGRLDKFTHNKSIQKAIESYRVTDEHKEYLRSLRLK